MKAYLYKDAFTRQVRGRTGSVILTILNNLPKIEVDIDGCAVHGTPPYVDISSSSSDIDLWECSYVRFANTVDSTIYYAFIDRVEANNFNTTNMTAYRVYITIDWWTMFAIKNPAKLESMLSKLEGEVVRGHVCDVVKSQSGYWRPNPYYLILSAETEYGEVENHITDYLDEPCLYVVSSEVTYIGVGQATEANLPLQSQGIYSNATGDYDTQVQGYVYAFPLDISNDSDFKQPASPKQISVHNNNNTQSVILELLPTIHSITDRSVIKQMVYPFCPNYFTDSRYKVNTDWNVIDIPKFSYTIGGSKTAQGAPLFYDKNEHSMALPTMGVKYGEEGVPSLSEMTYSNYLSWCVRRKDMPPYTEYAFVYGNNELPLPVHYTPLYTDWFDFIISPDYDGGLICRYVTTINDYDYHKDVAYMPKGTFTPLYTYDSETVQRMELVQKEETTNHIFNQISNARQAASGVSMGIRGVRNLDLGERLGGGNRIGEGIINMAKEGFRHSIANDKIALENTTLRLTGENGFSTQKGINSLGDWSAYISGKRLNSASYDKVVRDLALYGYNTYLHPHELFNAEHKRKYFNYIKTSGANLAVAGVAMDIKLHIEEMFNNGVWLWNTHEEFGNFEVPNYLLIMED